MRSFPRARRAAVAVAAALAVTLGSAATAAAAPVVFIPGVGDVDLGQFLPGMAPPPAPAPSAPAPFAPAPPAPGPLMAPPAPAPFAPPSVNPASGEVVGVAQPVIIRFNAPVGDRAAAERAIRVTSTPPVAGFFYWFNNSQVRWRPHQFWPAHTRVSVVAGGTTSNFSTGDAVVSVADDWTKTITVTRNGQVVKTMPTSMGKNATPTPNGTYIIGERYSEMWMDSSTYGVPVDSPNGYRTYVRHAVRMSNSGIFVHGAPWSVASQGNTNVSHGCLNVSPADAEWFYYNTRKGDPVIVRNTVGGRLPGWDGLGDWNL